MPWNSRCASLHRDSTSSVCRYTALRSIVDGISARKMEEDEFVAERVKARGRDMGPLKLT